VTVVVACFQHANRTGSDNKDGMVFLLYSVVRFFRYLYPEPECVNLFKESMNRFPSWRAGTTALFDVPARQATYAGGIDSWAPEKFTNSGSANLLTQLCQEGP
jgi:hypothetical protein